MPPRMTIKNILQMLSCPSWTLATMRHGQPSFKSLTPYLPKGLNLKNLGLFMNKTFNGRLSEEKIKILRDKWKGKLVLKGVASTEDAEKAIALGLDGIIVSNHGGRQLDAGQSSIAAMRDIVSTCKGKTTIMMDSGLREGPDIASALACGADFTFLGRSFMYGVSALGKNGGHHTISMLKTQLNQVLEQICCGSIRDLPKHLVSGA
jgi:L-lactate dehydrogenase (cytochrome)